MALLVPGALAFLAGSPLAPPPVPMAVRASPAIRMEASFTTKDDLLLEEEIERRCAARGACHSLYHWPACRGDSYATPLRPPFFSGVEADIETDDKAVDTSVLDSIKWTPSARGEPGKTPRDLAFGPLKNYCANLYEVERRK